MIESPTATGTPWEARSSAIQRSMTISSGPGIASRPPCSSTRSPTGRLVVSMPTTVEYGMLAAAGLPSTRGVIALARKASVGRPPIGPSTRSAARSAAGGSSSRRELSRQAPLPAGVSKMSPTSSSEGLTAARKMSASCVSCVAIASCVAAALVPFAWSAATRPLEATESSTLAEGTARRRIACAVASDVMASPPVTCVGRNEKSPRPSAGSTSATRSRRLHESAVRRPSGLSAGTSPSFVIRSTIASPGRAPRLSASTRLIATVSAAGTAVSGTNPSECSSSQAKSVARAVRTARSPAVPSSETSITIAGTIAGTI